MTTDATPEQPHTHLDRGTPAGLCHKCPQPLPGCRLDRWAPFVAIALAAAAAALSVVDYSIVEVARNLTQGATLVALGCALGAFHRREHDRATRTEQRYAEPI